MQKIGWTQSARNASTVKAQIRRNMIILFGIIMIVVSFAALTSGINTIEIIIHGVIHSSWIILSACGAITSQSINKIQRYSSVLGYRPCGFG